MKYDGKQTIYKLGARKVIFHGLGPLGCIPSQRVKSKTGMCLKRVNEWVMEFNTRTKKLLEDLNKRLPGAKFAFADTYPAVLDLIDNPTRYGKKILLIVPKSIFSVSFSLPHVS